MTPAACFILRRCRRPSRSAQTSACERRDAKARLDTLAAHGIYPIARIVVAKDPLLAERKASWSVKDRGHRRPVARKPDQHRMGGRVQRLRLDLFRPTGAGSRADGIPGGAVRLRALPRRAARTDGDGHLPRARAGQTQREAVREHVALLKDRLKAVRGSRHVRHLRAHGFGDDRRPRHWAGVGRFVAWPTSYYRWCTRATTTAAPSGTRGPTASPTTWCAAPSSTR